MTLIDADKLRERLKESNPTPYDAKFMAMINELAFETDVNEEYYQKVFDKYLITERIDSLERITKMLDWIESGEVSGDLSDYLRLLALRRKIIRGIG